MSETKTLGVEQVAQMAGMSTSTVRRLVAAKKLHGQWTQKGQRRFLRFKEKEVQKALALLAVSEDSDSGPGSGVVSRHVVKPRQQEAGVLKMLRDEVNRLAHELEWFKDEVARLSKRNGELESEVRKLNEEIRTLLRPKEGVVSALVRLVRRG